MAFAGPRPGDRHGREERFPGVSPDIFARNLLLTHSDMGFRHPIDSGPRDFHGLSPSFSIGAGKQQQNPELHPISS